MQEEKEKKGAAITTHEIVVVVAMRVNSKNQPHSLILNFAFLQAPKHDEF